jgi:hypothetical protein
MMFSELPDAGWRIMKFVSDSDRDLIEDWLEKLPIGERKGVRIELEAILRFLRFVRAELWVRPQFAWLQGDQNDGIGEIIVDYRGVPYRPLGCFGPAEDQFTILTGARKDRKRRGKVQWDPQDALSTASKRKALLPGRSNVEYIL